MYYRYKCTSTVVFFAKFNEYNWNKYKNVIEKNIKKGRKQYYCKYMVGNILDYIKDYNNIYKLFECNVPRIFKYFTEDKIKLNLIKKSKLLQTCNNTDYYVVIGAIGKHNPGIIDINNTSLSKVKIEYFNFYNNILKMLPKKSYNLIYYKYMINDILDEFIDIHPKDFLNIINAGISINK
ncbi:hypothetical protein AHEV_143 [Adoxophyes honmai entomopoxvirus 'L']|uniref:Uncharacterized protein n=1 Tax=Adoxophyes honmai entomopoxvirus 'L' TaxID=1293540 RepID=A0A916KP51_9POXV|nr:hypothetical protein AHEV_143 [Adoxophyes honmai entomopoxvirus 'L']CCU55464.1 hypothetical protein AHEV_143 [Adoxophyes honmai entomopoxvirus 'L']